MFAVGLCVFAWFGMPRDPFRKLGSHLFQEQVSYSEERDPLSGEIVFNCHRTADVRGLSMKQVNDRLHADYAKPGQAFLLFVSDSGQTLKPSAKHTGLIFPKPDANMGTVVFIEQLSPIQVLWVRMTHLGVNPFGKSIASPGRVERLITARP